MPTHPAVNPTRASTSVHRPSVDSGTPVLSTARSRSTKGGPWVTPPTSSATSTSPRALNDDEIAYLSAFSQSRRFARAGGPYDVPGNPRAEEYDDVDRDAYNENAPGQPGLWCD